MHNQESEPAEPAAILQLWGLAQTSARGPKARADLAAVAAAAVQTADEEGFEAVTLASIARRLGLTTTALYRYVDSKATLLEIMLDHALGPAPVLTKRGHLRRVEEWVAALLERYTQHAWLSTFPLERPPRSPNAVSWIHTLITQLQEARITDPLGSALAIDVLVRGYAGLARMAAHAPPPSPALAAQIAERYPALHAGVGRSSDLITDLQSVVRRIVMT